MAKWDFITNEEILECARNGMSVRVSAEELGMPLISLKRLIKERNLYEELNELKENFKINNTNSINNNIIELFLKGLSLEKISKELSIDIYKVTKEMNKSALSGLIAPGICENCGNENNYDYGSGRFCGEKCARASSTRELSEESISLRNEGLRRGRETQTIEWNKYNDSLKTDFPLKRPYNRNPNIESWTTEKRSKLSEKMKDLWEDEEFRRLGTLRNQNVSDETRLKISIARKKAIAEGRVVPWGVHSGESYPEKYFTKVLEDNGIEFEKQYKIVKGDYVEGESGSYFLDFYIEINGVKIDLEIDGSHHWLYNGAIEKDAKRNAFMESIGYEVYRIRWCSPNKNRGRDIQQKIDDLLEFLNNFENKN